MNIHHSTLATRFGRNARVVRSATPLTDDQMRQVAPSIFAQGKHVSRSDKYTLYLPGVARSFATRGGDSTAYT